MKNRTAVAHKKAKNPDPPKRKTSLWRVARIYLLFFCLIGIISLAAFNIVSKVLMHLGILQ